MQCICQHDIVLVDVYTKKIVNTFSVHERITAILYSHICRACQIGRCLPYVESNRLIQKYKTAETTFTKILLHLLKEKKASEIHQLHDCILP